MSKAQHILRRIIESAPPAIQQRIAEVQQLTRIKIGQFYARENSILLSSDIYLLAMVRPQECALVSLIDGNRWKDPVKVINIYNIDPSEWLAITGKSNFIRSPIGESQ